MKGFDVKDVCRQFYREDVATLAFLKSAASPGSTTDPSFAGSLIGNTVGAFLTSLAPASAIASIIPTGLSVDLESFQELTLPYRTTAAVARPWVAENDAIPVSASSFGHAQLGPASKVGVIAVASRELLRRSYAEAVFERMVKDDAAISLDTVYLTTAAAGVGYQAGLLHGVTPLPAVSSGFGAKEQMAEDLSALGSAVATGGFGSVVFIVSPARALRIQIIAPDLRLPVLPSLAVPDGRVIALDPVSLVHGFGANPDLIWATAATIHMDDAALPISDGGVTAAPVRSLWQTDSTAVRAILDIAFTKRRANAVAFMDEVATW